MSDLKEGHNTDIEGVAVEMEGSCSPNFCVPSALKQNVAEDTQNSQLSQNLCKISAGNVEPKQEIIHICNAAYLENSTFNTVGRSSEEQVPVDGEILSKQSSNSIGFNRSSNTTKAYNPAKASAISTVKMTQKHALNIGSPICNTKCYVLADNLVPVPIAAQGELYIGGAGLARGYLNRQELTAEKFIANPFQTEEEKRLGKNSKLYRTGDLVRWLPNGNLEYIGRNDLQVKIRGYRIELGEVESALLSYKGIKQSVALAKERDVAGKGSSGSKYLVGYYVSDDKLDEESILNYLGSRLPDYMVPTFLVHLHYLPLNINGKLDKEVLPDPEFINHHKYVAPRNEIEETVCHIWAEVLGLHGDKVGTHDDFFGLGGDSIFSIQVVSRLRKKLQLNVTVNDIFSLKTIANLYENVLSKQLDTKSLSNFQTEQGMLVGVVPLLPIQELFFWCDFLAPHHCNQSFLIYTPRLDLDKLQESLNKLVKHHDSFRLRYKKDDKSNSYEQYYDGDARVEEVKVLDITTLGYHENSQIFRKSLQELLTDWQAHFNLTDGPMYSVGYMHGYKDGSARIHFALHHLIVDAVSWRIMSEDLRDLYCGKILSSKGSSYRQWAKKIKDYPSRHQEEEPFWKNMLSDYDSDRHNDLLVSESTVHCASLELSRKYTRLLLRESNQAYHTEISDLLITALGYSLTEITGSSINHIILEGHGREEIDNSIDITRTVGWFTTIYPVRLEIFNSLGTTIKSIKEALRTIPRKGLGFGPIFSYKSNGLPKVCFNYLGQFGHDNTKKIKDKNIWQITEENSGIPVSPSNCDINVIDISGLIIGGKLRFRIESKLSDKTTHNLAKVFKQKLEVVIDHAVSQPRSYLTASGIDKIVSNERLDALQKPREIKAIYLANHLQQGFIYHALSQQDGDDAYQVQQIWQYSCPVNIDVLKQAWEYAQKQFSALRLRFDWQENLVQIIDKESSLDWRYTDISNQLNIDKQKNLMKDIQEKDRLERYNLAKGNLFRIYLIKQNRDLYSCIFSNHHAILDGWSTSILLGYVHDTYLKLDRKVPIFLQPDYVYEEAQRYFQEHKNDDKTYWEKYIAKVDGHSDLSGLLLKRDEKLCKIKKVFDPMHGKIVIPENLYCSLKLLSREEGVTFSAILQYVWHKVLYVYGNNKQTIVGTTISERSIPIDGIEKSVGLYINTLPLIVDHQENKSLLASIKDIQSSIIDISGKSNINLAKLQPSAERLFDSLFVYQNYPTPNLEAQEKLKMTFKGTIEKSDYPLNVKTYEQSNELIFRLEYAGELFSENTINELLFLTRTLLEQLPTKIHHAVSDLCYLNVQNYDQIIHRWNATDAEYPANKTIHKLFEGQVSKKPDKVAIVYKELQLTYRELNERANQLAIYLIEEFKIEPDSLISLCLNRSVNMIIAILGVLKAGGAYVPIDPSYPDERIQYILEDTQTGVLLTNEIYQKRLEDISRSTNTIQEPLAVRTPLNVLSIDSQEFKDKLLKEAIDNPNTMTTCAHLANVIYTSGTTGKPKGVMIEHKGLANLNYALVNRYALGDINNNEVILQFSNYVFDASIEEIILGLLNGYVLLLIPDKLWLSTEKFTDYLRVNKVSYICTTPRFLEQHKFNEISSLKRVVSAGEVLSKKTYDKLCLSNSIKVINTYGPTEASVSSTVNYFLRDGDLNIGSPIFNTKCYVLADNLVPVPVAAMGELYIGGAGLARGYLNRPDLTAERFITNPFQTEEDKRLGKNTRLYKTGDLVRWLPDGNLEYIGRTDLQVKIRGYRIELGEVESALLGYEGIKQSVVLAKEHSCGKTDSSGSKYLVGYYVSDDKLDGEEILHYVASKLPNYMVPTILVHLKSAPLTTNGKLDRKALPDPEFTSQNACVASRNEIEDKVCRIWAEVLQTNPKKVGTHDDFFRQGGDSIDSINLVSRLRKELELNMTVNDIFNHKTIARLYDNVFSKQLSEKSELSFQFEQRLLDGIVPLLPIQEWFFSRNFSAAHHWNQSFLIQTPRLNIEKLQRSLDTLVRHHGCFRLRYKKDERSNTYKQYYERYAKVEPVKILDIRTLGNEENSQAFKSSLEEVLTKWQANFNLTDGPMYNVGYMHGYKDGSARIHFALHHLIVDAGSWRIISEDLSDLYYGRILVNKSNSYGQWAKIMGNYTNKHQEEEPFWKSILSSYKNSQLNHLKVSESAATHITSIELGREYTKLLLQNCNQAYHTQIEDLLLTALGYSLYDITGNFINHVLLKDHGRNEIDKNVDITGTVGWFTVIYPIRLEISDAVGATIKSIKEFLRTIPNKGLGFGLMFGYESIDLPRVSFNYIGHFGHDVNEKGTNEDVWQIAEENSGISKSAYGWETNLINFKGLIINGSLRFSIMSKLGEETTHNLARVFKQQLEVIINHTVSQPRNYLTVSDVDKIIGQERLDALQESREVKAVYLANNLQQGFIYHAVSHGDVDDAYQQQHFWQYGCTVNVNFLKKAWEYAQKKFSSLRLRFNWQEDLVQIIDEEGSLDWHFIDLSNELDTEKQENSIKDIQKKDRITRYDLTEGNLFRIYLIKQNRNLHSCIFSNHHTILDGWSMSILLGYVHDTYFKLDRKEQIVMQPDYTYETAQRYYQEHREDDKAYWERYIAQANGRTDLSGLLLQNVKKLCEYKQTFDPSDKTLAISGKIYNSLKVLSKQEGVTLNAILQYVWHKVLHVYGSNKQTIVGTTVSGRSLPLKGLEKSVGLYINTLPLIVNHQENKLLIASIRDIQSSIGEFNVRSNINLAKLQSSAGRLFDSLFVYQNYPAATSKEDDKMRLKFEGIGGKIDYPLNVTAYEANHQLIFQLEYASELFSEDIINNLLYLTRTILEQLPSSIHHTASDLYYLNDRQYDQIIHRWNATGAEYPSEKRIHKLFEAQVSKTPDRVAIVYKEIQLTYRELNERANQLAIYLIEEFKIEPDSLVSLCLDRSECMIIAILAVLKSGGAYVPIDPSFPDARIQYILQDTSAAVLLTNEIHHARLKGIMCLGRTNLEFSEARRPLNILSIDSLEFKEKLSVKAVINPDTSTIGEHLAYVIYTSGTTGKPKGVMVEHRGLVNLNYALLNRYALGCTNDREVILQFSNYVFDASVEQIILGVLNGHVLLLIPDQLWLDKVKFNEYLFLNKVTHIDSTPRFLEQHNFNELLSLKRLILGGEVSSAQSYDKICSNNNFKIINAYGSTETSVTSTVKIIRKGDLNRGSSDV